MTSPAITYASPSEAHTPIGSPAPSQILLRRVASPNHLAHVQQYVDSPRSFPVDYSQYDQRGQQEQFQFEQPHDMYMNDESHIYDFGPNGPLPVEPQFVQPDMSQNGDDSHFMYMPALQIQPPTPMHGQFGQHLQANMERSMTPYSDTTSDFTMEGTPDINGHHLVDISSSGFPMATTQYAPLPRSQPMPDQLSYLQHPVFDEDDYDSRSPSPGEPREQVKRPLNAFMLYRKDKQNEIPTSNHQSVSRIIGAMWKSESAETKSKYNLLAQKEREVHRNRYPGYKYSPKKRISKEKKVKRTMSQAAHAKRQEEEKQILKQINKRSKSEGTLTQPLPEFLPLPKSKQNSVAPEERSKSSTPAPENSVPRLVPQIRSQSAQPTPVAHDYSKFTSNPAPQQDVETVMPQSFVPSHFPEPFEPYFGYPVDFNPLSGGEASDTPFTDTDSFVEFSADGNIVCSPAEFTPFDERALYGNAFTQRDDIEIFRMNSPFAAEQAEFKNQGIHNVFGTQWSRESTVNPQDLFAQPEDA